MPVVVRRALVILVGVRVSPPSSSSARMQPALCLGLELGFCDLHDQCHIPPPLHLKASFPGLSSSSSTSNPILHLQQQKRLQSFFSLGKPLTVRYIHQSISLNIQVNSLTTPTSPLSQLKTNKHPKWAPPCLDTNTSAASSSSAGPSRPATARLPPTPTIDAPSTTTMIAFTSYQRCLRLQSLLRHPSRSSKDPWLVNTSVSKTNPQSSASKFTTPEG